MPHMEFEEKDLKSVASSIVFDLADKDLTVKEAIDVLELAKGIVKKARTKIFLKVTKESLKETLRDSGDYSSSINDSLKS